MKRFLSALFVAAIGLFAPSCSIDDDYDLNKDIDKTFELKNFTFKLNETYTFNIKEILLEEYPLSSLELLVLGGLTDIKVTLKNGLLGDFKVDGIAKDLTDDYLFKHGVVSAAIINNLPEPIMATVEALDSKGKVIPEITATLTPQYIRTGTSILTIDVRGSVRPTMPMPSAISPTSRSRVRARWCAAACWARPARPLSRDRSAPW